MFFFLFARARRWLSYWFLKQAMRRYGCTSPVIADADGVIVDGNRRVMIARELGMESVPMLHLNATVKYVDPYDLKTGCSLDFKNIWWEDARQ